MPRKRHWFHVSHDINSDGEVWELTDKFGVSGLRVWLELLSIADRNEGRLPIDSEASIRQLSIKCNTTQRHLRGILEFIQSRLWIVSDPSPRIRNWAIYNPSTEGKRAVESSPPTSLPLPSLPKDAEPTPSADFKKEKPKRGLDPKIKEIADRIYHSDPPRFARLIAWIKDKEKRDYPPEVIIETLAQFEAREKTTKVKDWWPYIERIHTKVYGQWNEAQAAKVKDSENKFVLNLVKATGGNMS
jgi:hypothetical protein